MPANIADFVKRFSGRGTMDDREASEYVDRFASNKDEDRDFNNDEFQKGAGEYLEKMPDDQFNEAARGAFERTPPEQRSGLVRTLLGSLQGKGIDISTISSQLGIGSTDPQRMGGDDYARLANYARHQKPEVMRETVRQQPGFLKALGNPIVMGALTMVATRMLRGGGRKRGLLGRFFKF